MNYDKIVTVMRRLARDAGAQIMQIYEQKSYDIELKSDQSPVTQADLTADATIRKGLMAAFPNIPFVTEESAESHSKTHDVFFLVDPLDGTKEFIHKRGEFTVNIALIEHGVPKLGVVYAPALGRLFYTSAEQHAFEETILGKSSAQKRITVAENPHHSGLRVVASKSHRSAETDRYIAQYQVAELVSAGSSLKFCLLATGEADLYPRLGRTMEWDTAAGDAVLRAAGGHVVEAGSLMPMHYGKANYENPHFIAYAPNTVQEVLKCPS